MTAIFCFGCWLLRVWPPAGLGNLLFVGVVSLQNYEIPAKHSGMKTPSGGQKAQQGLGPFYPLRRAL